MAQDLPAPARPAELPSNAQRSTNSSWVRSVFWSRTSRSGLTASHDVLGLPEPAALDASAPLISDRSLRARKASILPNSHKARSMRLRYLLLGLGFAATAFIALPNSFRAASLSQAESEPSLEFGPAFAIEERNDVLIVKPRVSYDPLGGFLVADARERQIRRYNADGTLDRVIARRGDGPGEFRHPVGVLRLKNRKIVGVDMRGRLSIFDERGEKLTETQQVPLVPIYSAAVLDDSTLVFAGRVELGEDSRMVHVWDLKRQRIVRSFGEIVPPSPEFESAYTFTGSASVAVRDSSVALLFGLGDSIRVFRRSGREVASIPIPWQKHRPLKTPMPTNGDDAAIDQWLSTFSVAASFFWRPDGSFVVQYLDVNGVEETWSIVGFLPTGSKLFEFHDQPRLLTVAPGKQSLLFVDRNSELQNSWALASIQ